MIYRKQLVARMVGTSTTNLDVWIEKGIIPPPTHRIPESVGKGWTIDEVAQLKDALDKAGKLPRETLIKRFVGKGACDADRAADALIKAGTMFKEAREEFPALAEGIEVAEVRLVSEPWAVELWVRF